MQETFSLEAFIFVIILIIYIMASHVIQAKKVPYLHESTIAIFMGILTAFFAKYGLKTEIQFSNQLFFALILPPIIFSAGYSLRKSLFFDNFGLIWFLGVFGTIIGFICLTAFIMLINNYIFKILSFTQVMMISSVMCATDTLAAISLIKPDKYPVLNAVMFGEGIINDAVAIILFRTITQLKLNQSGQFTIETVTEMTFNFTYLFFFSVTFGTITGFGLSYLFKQLQSFNNHSIKQTSLILLNGYFTYLMGQLLGISGIISLFTCAIIMGHYCFINISEQSQKGTGLAFQTVGYISQAFVFAYLGASLLQIEGPWSAILMALCILISMPFIRAIMVYFLPLVYKIIKKPFLMDDKQLKVCWFSGIVRGVIAFALCLQIETENKKFIVTVALVIVMCTTICGSTLIKSFMKMVGLLDQEEMQNQQEQAIMLCRELKNNTAQKVEELEPHTNYKSIGFVQKPGASQIEGSFKSIDQNSKEGDKISFRNIEKFQEKFIRPYFNRSKKQIELEQNPNKLKRQDIEN